MTLKKRLSDLFRGRRDKLLKALITRVARRGEVLRILDVGGSAAYWQRLGLDFLREQRVHVDLLNHIDEELRRDPAVQDVFTYIVGDARDTGLADMAYDMVHSNSVIEHVGQWRDMQAFAREVHRLAPAHYVQTPNFWFPIEPHYWRFPMMHWLPHPVRIWLFYRLPIATAGKAPDYETACYFADLVRLLNRAQMRCLFPRSELHAERVLLLAKSWTAIQPGPGGSANP